MRKIQYLDGLRGLAAFVVVFHHFILAFYPALFFGVNAPSHLKAGEEVYFSGSVLNLLYNGNFAVCIFFVMSGFVLSYKFFLHKDHEIITQSAVKRYFRLVVPVGFSVFAAFFLMKWSFFYNQQAANVTGSDWLGGFWRFTPNFTEALNQTFIGTFFSGSSDYNVTLWTIAYEFLGSFLVFGFLALFGKMKNRAWAYLAAIIFFFQTYYLAFILGVLLSDLIAHKNSIVRNFDRSKIIRTVMLLGGLFLGSYPSGRSVEGTIYAFLNKPNFENAPLLYHTLGAFLVMIVLLDSRRMQKFFSLKYLLFLGEISFAMYLLHFIILGSFSSFLFLKLNAYFPYADAFWLSFVVSIGFIFLVSYWVYLLVDRNAIKISKFIYEKMFRVN